MTDAFGNRSTITLELNPPIVGNGDSPTREDSENLAVLSVVYQVVQRGLVRMLTTKSLISSLIFPPSWMTKGRSTIPSFPRLSLKRLNERSQIMRPRSIMFVPVNSLAITLKDSSLAEKISNTVQPLVPTHETVTLGWLSCRFAEDNSVWGLGLQRNRPRGPVSSM